VNFRYNKLMDHSIDTAGQKILRPNRIEALHDGVFAIVMTLLVLEMKIPEVETASALQQELLKLLPIFTAYIVTFVNLGIYWVGFHILFSYIERSDRVFAWINVLFLLLISLLPFSTGLLGQYPAWQIPDMLYGIHLIAIGLVMYAIWCYATQHHRLTAHTIDNALVHNVKTRILVAPVAAVVAIALSFWWITGSLVIYLLILPYYIFPGRIDKFWRQRAVPHSH
jgi:uncharacterized membrane protein